MIDTKYGHEIRNTLHNFFNHSQVNLFITSSIILSSAYLSLVTVLDLNIAQPFAALTHSRFSSDALNELIWSTVSLFILLVISLIAGKGADLLNLPPLFGSMVIGIVLKNVPYISSFLVLNDYCEYIARRLALVTLIIRWGISINGTFIRQHPILPIFVGLFTSTIEAASIFLAAHFVFHMSLPLSILLAYILTTVSGAVTQPVMIDLQNEKLGSEKNIPQLISAISCFDTIYCLTAFSLVASVTFSDEPMFPTLVRTIGQIIVCAITGLIIGWILWWFPRNNEPYTHLARTFQFIFISVFIILGMFSLNCGFAGIVGILCMTFVACSKWKVDNDHGIYIVERTFTNIWNLFSSPLLYVLVGLRMDFALMNWSMLWIALALISMGWLARIASTLLATSFSGFKFREQFVIALGLLPKGTVQAALGPSMLAFALPHHHYVQEAAFVLTACIICVVVTSSIGRLLLSTFAPILLRRNFNRTVHITSDERPEEREKNDDLESVITFKQFKSLQQTQVDNKNGRTLDY